MKKTISLALAALILTGSCAAAQVAHYYKGNVHATMSGNVIRLYDRRNGNYLGGSVVQKGGHMQHYDRCGRLDSGSQIGSSKIKRYSAFKQFNMPCG